MARAIDPYLNQIRTAVYGREVRSAIADGIEQCYDDSTANAQKADIEAKGAEVLASIPDTYEDLQNDVDNLKSAIKAEENNGHAGIKYTGVKFAGSNTTVAGTSGSVAVYRMQPNDKVKIVLKANSTSGIYIDRDGVGLSNNPVPTIGETIKRVGSTHAMTTDTTIEFENTDGYKYCYVYYSSADASGDPNVYVTFTTQNTDLQDSVNVVNDKITDLQDSVKVDANDDSIGVVYSPCKINSSKKIVTNDYGSLAVYRIKKNHVISVALKYSATALDRNGIAFSNKKVPESGDDVVLINGISAVSADQTFTICNRDYDYLYVYYYMDVDNDSFAANVTVTQTPVSDAPYGYTEITTGWNQGSNSDPTSTTRIISDLIASDPVGRRWRIVVPTGYKINIFTYDYYGTEKDRLYDTLQDGTIDFTVIRQSFKVMVARPSGDNIIPQFGGMLQIFKMNIANQYDDLKYKGKRVSIMGDSISTYGSIADKDITDKYSPEGNEFTFPGNKCRYPQTSLLVLEPGQTYWMKAITNLGMVLGINDSIAGSKVSNPDGTTPTVQDGHYGAAWYMAMQDRIDRLDDNGTPDIILVNGGTNDINMGVDLGEVDYSDPSDISDFSTLPVDTFANAYRTMLLRMMHTYPSAKIVCLLPDFAAYSSEHGEVTMQRIDQYEEVIKEVCDMLGVPWIDIRTSGISPLNKSTYLSDGIHPNYRGMQLIGDRLTTALISI